MNILVCQPVTPDMLRDFETRHQNFEFIYSETPSEEQFAAADIIFGFPDTEMLKHAKKLRLLQLSSSGADKHNCAVPLSVPICTTTGVFGREIGEVLLSQLLALKKHLHTYRDFQSRHHWEFLDFNRPLTGSNVLILGLGDIGMGFAKLLRAFDCHIVGVRRTLGKKPDCVDEVHTMDKLGELLPLADVVAMCLPDTPQTRDIMTRERIFSMKKDSILLNIGRGSALDTGALIDAVKEGHLYGAALDVIDVEPLPPEHPIWDVENIIITPHTAGRSYSPYIIRSTGDIFMQNLAAFLAGEELITPVDRETGYMASRA